MRWRERVGRFGIGTDGAARRSGGETIERVRTSPGDWHGSAESGTTHARRPRGKEGPMMSVLQSTGWFAAPNWVFDSDLSWSEKLVYLYLCRRSGPDGS